MKFLSYIVKAIKKLKPLIDVIVKGREVGLWQKGQAPVHFAKLTSETIPVSNGMSNTFAAAWASFIGVAVAALQTTLQGLDWSAVLQDPKIILPAFLAAFAAAWSHRMQRPGQASVMLGSSAEVRKEAETFTSLKIDVPLRVDGGK